MIVFQKWYRKMCFSAVKTLTKFQKIKFSGFREKFKILLKFLDFQIFLNSIFCGAAHVTFCCDHIFVGNRRNPLGHRSNCVVPNFWKNLLSQFRKPAPNRSKNTFWNGLKLSLFLVSFSRNILLKWEVLIKPVQKYVPACSDEPHQILEQNNFAHWRTQQWTIKKLLKF